MSTLRDIQPHSKTKLVTPTRLSFPLPRRMADKTEFTLIKGEEDVAKQPKEEKRAPNRRKIRVIVAVVATLVFLVVLAFVAGFFIRSAVAPSCKPVPIVREKKSTLTELEELHKEAMDAVLAEKIEENLK